MSSPPSFGNYPDVFGGKDEGEGTAARESLAEGLDPTELKRLRSAGLDSALASLCLCYSGRRNPSAYFKAFIGLARELVNSGGRVGVDVRSGSVKRNHRSPRESDSTVSQREPSSAQGKA